MTLDTQKFKDLLIEQKASLEKSLGDIAKKNPQNPTDWQATMPEDGFDEADEGDVADNIETFENNSAEAENLEIQLKEVNSALEKIENGNYGICEIGGEEIESDRLEANPSARTCKAHMN